MFKLFVNEKKGTIEMSKKFAAAAKKFGTDEYKALQEVRRDYPGFKTVVVSKNASKKGTPTNGLSYEFMEKYIEKHDDEQKSIMAEYEMLRGTSDEAKELEVESLSFIEIKEWFLKKFPAIAEFHKKRETLLAG